MKCSKCGKSSNKGAALGRTNPVGEPGVWVCLPNCDVAHINFNSRLAAVIEAPNPHIPPERQTVSFRVECKNDLDRIIKQALMYNCDPVVVQEVSDIGFPDIEVELTIDAWPSRFRDVIQELDDVHVAVESMRACPRADNSMKRTYPYPDLI